MVFGQGDYPPFYMADPAKPDAEAMQGMFIEFLDAFEKAHPEYPIEKRRLSRMRLDAWMEMGKADAMSLNSPLFVDKPDRFAFSEPLWRTGDMVITWAASGLEYETPQDLYGKTIGLLRGNRYGSLEEHFGAGKIRTHEVDDDVNLLRMLVRGRLDAIVLNIHGGLAKIRDIGLNPLEFSYSNPVLSFELSIQIQRSRNDFLHVMNTFIRQSQSNGLLRAIEESYTRLPPN